MSCCICSGIETRKNNVCAKCKLLCISPTLAKQIYLLDNDDLKTITLYTDIRNASLFLKKDVKEASDKKYKLFDVEYIKQSKINEKNKRQINLNEKQHNRKKILDSALQKHKIDTPEHGACYTYITLGKPQLSDVVALTKKESDQKNMRIKELLDKLTEKNLKYDSRMFSCDEYVNKKTNKSLDEIIRVAEIENYLLDNKNYFEYLNKYGFDLAVEKALSELTCVPKSKPLVNIKKNITRIMFD